MIYSWNEFSKRFYFLFHTVFEIYHSDLEKQLSTKLEDIQSSKDIYISKLLNLIVIVVNQTCVFILRQL